MATSWSILGESLNLHMPSSDLLARVGESRGKRMEVEGVASSSSSSMV